MLFACLRKDEDIIQVDDYVSFVQEVTEDLIHETLEGSRRIAETEGHGGWLEETPVGAEGCLPLVSFLDPDVIVAPAYVQLGEEPGVLCLIDELLDKRKGIFVLDGPFIELSIILDWAQRAILLFDKEER